MTETDADNVSFLKTRPIACKVEGIIFYIPSSLLCISPRLKACLNSKFATEAHERMIDFEEPIPQFIKFVQYLYNTNKSSFKPTQSAIQEYESSFLVLLADVYSMGERFLLEEFQQSIHKAFIHWHDYKVPLATSMCQLLMIASTKITARSPNDDPMRQAIFRLAAKYLSKLKTYSEFRMLLENSDIAKNSGSLSLALIFSLAPLLP
jgi:hypothetical protein